MNTGSLEFDVTKYWKFRKKKTNKFTYCSCIVAKNLNDPDVLVHYNIMRVYTLLIICRSNLPASRREYNVYACAFITVMQTHREYSIHNNMHSVTCCISRKSGGLE